MRKWLVINWYKQILVRKFAALRKAAMRYQIRIKCAVYRTGAVIYTLNSFQGILYGRSVTYHFLIFRYSWLLEDVSDPPFRYVCK